MPTPIEILMDPTVMTLIGIWLALMSLEFLMPGSELPKQRFWRFKGAIALVSYLLLASYLPMFTDQYLAPYRLLDLTGWGAWGGAIAAILVYQLGAYLWHRSMHESEFLWRIFHQMHHSPERLDVASAFYFSPMDMAGWTLLGSFTMVLVVGVTPEAAKIALFSLFFLSTFQHTRIRTPQWLGYFVQRPESHSIHHARGVHRFNYADLPIFDLIFGTFRNPERFARETGFYPGGSARVVDLLSFRNIGRSVSVRAPETKASGGEAETKSAAV